MNSNFFLWGFFLSPSDSYVGILGPPLSVMELRGGAFGKVIRSWDQVPCDDICVLSKEAWEKPSPFHCVRMQGKDAGDEAGRGPSLEHDHAGALFLDFQPPEQGEGEFLFISHPICSILLWGPEAE